MDTLSKDNIELAITEFRKNERYYSTKSKFSKDFDEALNSYTKGNFISYASILIKCFRIAKGELYKLDYKVYSPLRSIEIHDGGGETIWDQTLSEYYLGIVIDTLHNASIAMSLANCSYSPGQDILAIELSLKTAISYQLQEIEHKPNTEIGTLVTYLKDPLGESLEAACTTRKAAFILSQICLRKIRLSYLQTSEG